jgi:hypothetical protein
MDKGLCPGNYFDYDDDDVAIQREIEIMDGTFGSYVDTSFPTDGRSLYFDPMNPPRGSYPAESMNWFRIHGG